MSAEYDATEFVDADFQEHKTQGGTGASSAASIGGGGQRAPTREEVGQQVTEAHKKLAELKRAQEELERQRASLEETRRRQMEFQNGRQEMIAHLTRGSGLLEQTEFAARRDAEQMAKTLLEFRGALSKLQAIHEEGWTQNDFSVELTRALTAIENARMEWNAARLKFPVLSGAGSTAGEVGESARKNPESIFAGHSLMDLCKLGLAMTWPVALIGLLGVIAIVALILRR